MSDLSCPQCGNPQLDVDAQNDVVFCRRCGFAVKVDPQTGEATPLSQGGPTQVAPAVYSEKSILGTDPLTFLLGGMVVVLIGYLVFNLDTTLVAILAVIVFVIYWLKR